MAEYMEYSTILTSENYSMEQKKNAAFGVVNDGLFELFGDAFKVLSPLAEINAEPSFLHLLAYMSWVLGDHDQCSEFAHKGIAVAQDFSPLYKILAMNNLVLQKFYDAFLTASAGLENCSSRGVLLLYKELARAMMSGRNQVMFTDRTIEYTFKLSCFNGQAMESSLCYLKKSLNEKDELRYVKRFVGRAKKIVEIGVLVGNHSVFFLKNLEPEQVILIDADMRSLDQAKENFMLNLDDATTELRLIHSGVGDKEEVATIIDEEVRVDRLDNLIDEPVDFIKVDVDGWEMRFLEGARQTLDKYKPKVMIEILNDFEEEFLGFIDRVGYEVVYSIKRSVDTNYFLQPRTVSS